ncbi:MAG: hypothetical protein RL757_1903 [Bacteroidota bacterium]|jgi:hypothetical protein
MSNVICPISTERVSNQQVRRVASLVFVFGILNLFLTPYRLLLVLNGLFLAIDFSIRSFTSLPNSPLSLLANQLKKSLPFRNDAQFSDRAPKRFAAGLGFVFSIGISAASFWGFESVSFGLLLALSACAFLEAVFSVCLGCYVFVGLKKIFPNLLSN